MHVHKSVKAIFIFLISDKANHFDISFYLIREMKLEVVQPWNSWLSSNAWIS